MPCGASSTSAARPARHDRCDPQQIHRLHRFPLDRDTYKRRNAVERAFCRLKEFRAVATRYDKLARNFLAAIYLVAALASRIK